MNTTDDTEIAEGDVLFVVGFFSLFFFFFFAALYIV